MPRRRGRVVSRRPVSRRRVGGGRRSSGGIGGLLGGIGGLLGGGGDHHQRRPGGRNWSADNPYIQPDVVQRREAREAREAAAERARAEAERVRAEAALAAAAEAQREAKARRQREQQARLAEQRAAAARTARINDNLASGHALKENFLETKAAIGFFQKVLADDVKNQEARLELAKLFKRQGKYALAIEMLAAVEPRTSEALLELIELCQTNQSYLLQLSYVLELQKYPAHKINALKMGVSLCVKIGGGDKARQAIHLAQRIPAVNRDSTDRENHRRAEQIIYGESIESVRALERAAKPCNYAELVEFNHKLAELNTDLSHFAVTQPLQPSVEKIRQSLPQTKYFLWVDKQAVVDAIDAVNAPDITSCMCFFILGSAVFSS